MPRASLQQRVGVTGFGNLLGACTARCAAQGEDALEDGQVGILFLKQLLGATLRIVCREHVQAGLGGEPEGGRGGLRLKILDAVDDNGLGLELHFLVGCTVFAHALDGAGALKQ